MEFIVDLMNIRTYITFTVHLTTMRRNKKLNKKVKKNFIKTRYEPT